MFLFLFCHFFLSIYPFFLVKTCCFETPKHLWETKGKSAGPLNQQNQNKIIQYRPKRRSI